MKRKRKKRKVWKLS